PRRGSADGLRGFFRDWRWRRQSPESTALVNLGEPPHRLSDPPVLGASRVEPETLSNCNTTAPTRSLPTNNMPVCHEDRPLALFGTKRPPRQASETSRLHFEFP